jgi:hypothetical protein
MCYHCYDHWSHQKQRYEKQLGAWNDFLDYRKTWRAPEKFAKYESSVLGIIDEFDLGWKLELQRDRQTKLDEWREFYTHWMRRIRHCRRR